MNTTIESRPKGVDFEPDSDVHFVYVDNSNLWIEGQRASAVARGMAAGCLTAQRRQVLDHGWRYDFGRLYELVCPPGRPVGRSILFGSMPPEGHVWTYAEACGFEVVLEERNAQNREKAVDTGLTTLMIGDSWAHMRPDRGDTAVLVAGDWDYVPAVLALQERGLRVEVRFWEHSTNSKLREAATRFVPLDPDLAFLSLN
jgi:hypothetical protein